MTMGDPFHRQLSRVSDAAACISWRAWTSTGRTAAPRRPWDGRCAAGKESCARRTTRQVRAWLCGIFSLSLRGFTALHRQRYVLAMSPDVS